MYTFNSHKEKYRHPKFFKTLFRNEVNTRTLGKLTEIDVNVGAIHIKMLVNPVLQEHFFRSEKDHGHRGHRKIKL